ncbi:hypothetical protein [Microcystis aeruginosa]|uniref:hypothetical protein n=1 Tax=Microcystis aeruginosa TaxID=1126 RepID=UPI000776AA5A|nr:hypothetical protein [Microcystis aeruginosa]KXS91792.1 hypothetical protein OA58_08120 [Microcystis aeruginosa NIES-88]BCU11059.1 hypothetical protein MAN88_16230 [Microcystis aeruginosa]
MRRGTHARGTHAKGRINNQFLITGFNRIYGVVNWRREATLPLVVANSILTLQEYLTAQYIYDNDLIEKAVKNHVTETRWQEVFLLVAGLMGGKADKLLLS